MSSLQSINQNAEIARKLNALALNISAAKNLQSIMRTNLGPKGTIKMLVSGAGDIKLTKDGQVLLREMHINHPTAAMIARSATAQDDIVGDGTTSNVLLIGELLRQCDRFIQEGMHPRVLSDGLEIARNMAIEFLRDFRTLKPCDDETLLSVARTSLHTKLRPELADKLTEICVGAVNCINVPGQPLDLHMVEIMTMQHKSDMDTKLVNGLVLDHGGRHSSMPKRCEDAFILTLNVSLEYEKTEVNSAFYFSSADQREALVASERKFTDEKVRQIIALKRKVCDGTNKTFVVINQRGIDPPSLDMLAKEGILALRRAKRRNMERLALACGGTAVNSTEDLAPEVLGHADVVYEHVLGEEKYTFVEGVKEARSCTVLIRGPTRHIIEQIQDALRDGLRAVKNTLEDRSVVLGAGAFEIACAQNLVKRMVEVEGRPRLGVQAFADALLVIPKTLSENAGHDSQDTIVKLQDYHIKGLPYGLDLATGDGIDVDVAGIYDNTSVKAQMIQSSTLTAMQLLLVDEVIKAGRGMKPSDD